MRVLVLGAAGLIGHKLFERGLARFDFYGTINHAKAEFPQAPFLQSERVVENIDVLDFSQLEGVIRAIDPQVILNCVGITKRKAEINDPVKALSVNALFPHKLDSLCRQLDVRIIHFSTDCVFDGAVGNYSEDSLTTGQDAYGRTKAFGEITEGPSLTIRSSFIGREICGYTELLEWVLSQNGKQIKGFTNALYSGVSTIKMTEVVFDIIENHQDLSGLYQLATEAPISKYDLLCCARDAFALDIEIEPDSSFTIMPTLDGSRLRQALDLKLPDWPEMMSELAADPLYKSD
jgi:dTDP-4-dehydrorhamnose reductase